MGIECTVLLFHVCSLRMIAFLKAWVIKHAVSIVTIYEFTIDDHKLQLHREIYHIFNTG